MMVLEAVTTEGHRVADVERLAGLCALPGMVGAEWTGREGTDVR